jgi:arsenate reductase
MSKSEIIIYHNPRCSKSREALKLITENNTPVKIIEYLKTPPDFKELKDLLVKLNLKPSQIIRTNEELFKKNFKNKNFSDDEWIKILTENPILIERPIVIKGNKAVIGRPPQIVKDLI